MVLLGSNITLDWRDSGSLVTASMMSIRTEPI